MRKLWATGVKTFFFSLEIHLKILQNSSEFHKILVNFGESLWQHW